MIWLLLLIIPICSYFALRSSLNAFKSVGLLYWITKDNGTDNDPLVAFAMARQLGYPWKTGRGIQVRLGKYTIQIGLCKSHKEIGEDEDAGLLHAMNARILDTDASTIRTWQ